MKTQDLLSNQLSYNIWQYLFIMSFLLGESHGQRSLVGYSSQHHTESDMTKGLACTHAHTHTLHPSYLSILQNWKFFFFFFLILFFKFYFIFKLYITVLVLPNIKMNPPQVYMCSPSWKFIHFGCLLFNSPFPDPSASDNHKFDLFFYKFVCCQSIIDLQHYISFCYITQ